MEKRRLAGILGLILLSAIFLGFVGCTETEHKYESSNKLKSTQTTKATENSLKILSHEMIKEGNEFFSTIKVNGVAQNIGSKQLSYAEIRVKFYDESSNLLDSSLDNTNDLDPGEKWSFSVIYLGTSKVDDYKIAVGTTSTL